MGRPTRRVLRVRKRGPKPGGGDRCGVPRQCWGSAGGADGAEWGLIPRAHARGRYALPLRGRRRRRDRRPATARRRFVAVPRRPVGGRQPQNDIPREARQELRTARGICEGSSPMDFIRQIGGSTVSIWVQSRRARPAFRHRGGYRHPPNHASDRPGAAALLSAPGIRTRPMRLIPAGWDRKPRQGRA